jgi:hypothetical protein
LGAGVTHGREEKKKTFVLDSERAEASPTLQSATPALPTRPLYGRKPWEEVIWKDLGTFTTMTTPEHGDKVGRRGYMGFLFSPLSLFFLSFFFF